jgi:hypothetical protein
LLSKSEGEEEEEHRFGGGSTKIDQAAVAKQPESAFCIGK